MRSRSSYARRVAALWDYRPAEGHEAKTTCPMVRRVSGTRCGRGYHHRGPHAYGPEEKT